MCFFTHIHKYIKNIWSNFMKSILQELIQEIAASGATSAASIAGTNGATYPNKKKAKKKIIRRGMSIVKITNESVATFNFDDVLSKMKSAQKNKTNDIETVGFALEDDTGTIVKVYVKADQGEDFEEALGHALGAANEYGDVDSPNDDGITSGEIAEVLFSLKDKYDIIDVEFGEIPEDEEDISDDDGDPEGQDDEMVADDGDDVDGGESTPGADAADASTILTQVIGVMKAEAEAKKADAEAREAEAKAKEAGYSVAAAEEEVKQQEEILDMEEYNKKKKEKEKEEKEMADLAQYKSDLELDQVDVEDEEGLSTGLAAFLIKLANNEK